MMTSVGGDGNLFSRPMAMIDKAHEIASDRHVNLSCTRGDSRWVAISGTASVVRDGAKLRDLWSPFAEAWFPNGRENPQIGWINVNVKQVDYWETSSPKPVSFPKQTIAAVTGRPPDLGESGTLRP